MIFEECPKDYGNVNWQDGFAAELEGLTPEEQLRCFAWTTCGELKNIAYNNIESECRKHTFYLESIEKPEPYSVIVCDSKIVGIKIRLPYVDDNLKTVYKYSVIKPYESYCYASTSDNNGAGYKETDWYKYLICLPRNHTLW